MLLVPLLYVSIVAVIGHAVYWHAIYNGRLFLTINPLLALPLYFGPLFVGIVVLIFLVKPIFRGFGRREKPQRIRREAEPFLYEYVETICRSVHAPTAKSIRVMLDANAGAGFRGGLFSVLTGDLMLTIGLPLVAGMSVRQLSGILAHEFGHFSQGAGMRLSYFVRHANFWLERVVLERGSIDDWIDDQCHSSFLSGVVFRPLRMVVRLAQYLLLEIVWFAHAVSCFMTREMEFDADLYEVRLAGVNAFVKTTRQLPQLGVASSMAFGDLAQFYDEGRLADNFPALIV